MTFDDYTTLKFFREGRILRVSIAGNAPRNGVDFAMHEELARLFPELQRGPASDLIILTGEGRAFSAGGDMAWFQEMIDDPGKFRAIAPDAKRIVMGLLELEKPIICRQNGPAAGLGASIALLCDVIVADETAKIGGPHVKVGLVAGDGGAIIWPQLVGFARAKELLLSGELLSARDAATMGLVNRAVPADELDGKVAEIAAKILGNPRWPVRWTKTAVNIALKDRANKISDPAIAYEILSNMTRDRQEAVSAFLQKRKPVLSGEQTRGRSRSTTLALAPTIRNGLDDGRRRYKFRIVLYVRYTQPRPDLGLPLLDGRGANFSPRPAGAR